MPRRPKGLKQLDGRRAGQSWFSIGFGLTLGAMLAYLLVQATLHIQSALILVLLSLFVAVSLEPIVGWLSGLGMRRGFAVAIVLLAFAGVFGGFLALVIPPVAGETTTFIHSIPGWLQQLHDHHSTLGKLEDRFHLIEKGKQQVSSGGTAPSVLNGVLGASQVVLSTITDFIVVLTLTLYFLVGMPAVKRFSYRFVPGSHRPRVEELTEEILARIGRFMLGNLATSAIAGLATFGWLQLTDVPYSAALGIFVALMDLVPMVGSTIGGVVVSLIALAVSLPVAIATAIFYVAFRLAEDYLIMPKAMKYAVDVHPIVTVVAVLMGGALLGIIGALVAIPVAVAIGLVLDEVIFPRIENA
ncbi:AI-2E family transporter [Jatrophihabitans telluris]|uniref:AI-2E family transporter n=1 Tax=Jatrophihabitans telluris TaxID=2038343 RepID=A0ABY4QT10_9ACTN|nr:AI-2E family transporter [Jatrophihabitans telluris]UQX86869.1 AI-2E family transporter [Jatrophihabitans telluris]